MQSFSSDQQIDWSHLIWKGNKADVYSHTHKLSTDVSFVVTNHCMLHLQNPTYQCATSTRKLVQRANNKIHTWILAKKSQCCFYALFLVGSSLNSLHLSRVKHKRANSLYFMVTAVICGCVSSSEKNIYLWLLQGWMVCRQKPAALNKDCPWNKKGQVVCSPCQRYRVMLSSN